MAREPIQIVLLKQGTLFLLHVDGGCAGERGDEQHGCLCQDPVPQWLQRSGSVPNMLIHISK